MSWLTEVVTTMIGHANPALIDTGKGLGLQLEQFRNFDFRSMQAELEAVFENPKGIFLRHNGLSHRVALDGAGQYVDQVQVTYNGVPQRDQDVLAQMRKVLQVDMRLLDAEQAGVLQQAYVLALLPDATGRLRLHRFLPFEVAEVVITDPWADDDLAAADRVVLVKPITPPGNAGLLAQQSGISAWCARVTLTKTEAYIEMPDGVKTGIYNPEGTNPLGRVPVVGTRRARPANGVGYFPEVANDVLTCHIGLTLVISDCEFIARNETPTRVVATGMNAKLIPKKIPNTPMRIIPFEGDDITVQELQSQAPIEKYIRAAETAVYYLSQFRYLRPEAYQASIVTGSARRADAEGFTEDRRRHEKRTSKLEQDLAELMVVSYNAVQPRLLPLSVPEVTVAYQYVRAAENVLQEAQALREMFDMGLRDKVKEIADTEKVSMTVAAARLAERQTRRLEELKARAEAEGKAVVAQDAPADAAPPALDTTGGNVQQAALNGAQVDAMGRIIDAAARGQIPVETARAQLLAAFPVDEATVERMLSPLDGFTPTVEGALGVTP